MILGMQLYGPMAKKSMNLKDLFMGLSNMGINRVEPCISLDGIGGNDVFVKPDQWESFFSLIRECNLEVNSCHVSAANYLYSIPAMLELVEHYGVSTFVVGMPELTQEAIQERAFVYRQAAARLSDFGASLLVHNGKDDIAVKIDGRSAYEYMIDCCLGKAAMQFDVGWAAKGGADPMKMILDNKSRIASLHFKDFDMNYLGDQDTCIGAGTLDQEIYMQFGRAIGIPLYIDQDCYGDVLADAARSYRYLMDIGQQRAHTISFLNIYDTETGEVKVLQKFDGIVEAPNWVNNGNYLIYNHEGSIYRYDLDTHKSTRIESGIANHCNNDHVVAADEKHIAVSSDYVTEQGGGSRIFILPIEGGEARLITPNAPSYLHGWSPDGEELAYCAFRNVDGKQQVGIYTISAEGGEERCLTNDGFNDGPEYSPDGKHIWFISTKSGLMQVYRMNRDGSEATQMTFEERNNWFGHVSPDCKKVVNLAYRVNDSLPGEHLPNMQVELWMMNYDGSDRHRILEFFGGQGSINVNSWSGDSRYFAFVSYDVELSWVG